MEELHEECGIAGAVDLTGRSNVVDLVRRMIEELQHRGQLAAGLAIANGKIDVVKDNGRVREVLTPRRLKRLHAPSALAHVRYATAGSEDPSLAQPDLCASDDPEETFTWGWNGTITNAEELRLEELALGTELKTTGDTEIIRHRLLRGIQRHRRNLAAVFGDVQAEIDGAFNIVLLLPDGRLAAYRDAQGRHSLNYAVTQDRKALVASEDCAIHQVAPKAQASPIEPGELLIMNEGNVALTQVAPSDPKRCFFEWVYFSRRDSSFDGRNVGLARENFGEALAWLEDIAPEDSIVVAVPDSAFAAAGAFARTKGWPLVKGIENLLNERTFTASDPARIEKARRKYGIKRRPLEGRSIVLVDDSTVRGTTMRELVRRLRDEGGVRAIHLRLACPPILNPCYYGIDFPEIAELIARRDFHGTLRSGTLPPEVLEKIARRLGVDSIRFLPVEAIPAGIRCGVKSLCMACVTGKYPTPCGQRRFNEAEAAARRR